MLGPANDPSSDSGRSETGSLTTATVPQISLPKGGGAIRGIGEKFSANPVTGTASVGVPIPTSPDRSGFEPRLSLNYDSGAGNGPFGMGWNVSLPSITRRTNKGLPQYQDADESDVFILSDAEDLVPILVQDSSGNWNREAVPPRDGYAIHTYRPRIEGLFARIERWTRLTDGDTYWRTISKDNVTTFYGMTAESRITDPADPTHVFSWLICQSQNDKGSMILYSYLAEDDANIDQSLASERNRSVPGARSANRYPARIRYGNLPSLLVESDISKLTWLFEVVFDYGVGYLQLAAPDSEGRVFATATMTPTGTWPVRQDPFSRYRSCFEVRTCRLCQRILMFHHFAAQLGTPDCLVRSTELTYQQSSVASFITSITQSGYARQPDGTYLRKSMPQLDFQYTQAQVDETVREVDTQSIRNLPYGADGTRYRWTDLDSEGLTGILTEQTDGWYYKRNLGNGSFGAVERVATRPTFAALNTGRQELIDLAGEGQLDLVQFDGPMAGFHTRTSNGNWTRFTHFSYTPNINTRDPNLRLLDVTGDGFPDIVISDDTVFTWYESLAKDGFARAAHTPKSIDEERGPALVFADPTQSIFLADMSGDGLSDIVRIRYGEVCYWPNLGYGRFGSKVTMDSAPLFESNALFEPRRIRLADIDGSGNVDIIYVGHDGISLFFNQAGNAWSSPYRLGHYPQTDDLTAIAAVDLLGNGTACLVWSSPLPSNARAPMRYIDLMGGQKPYLLVSMTNNMGAETVMQYAASTKFYLRDRLEGRPWVTKLPFPVQVIERRESRDLVSNTQLVCTYRYRHGYYDGVEREFRGFAYVETRDAEQFIGDFSLPPVVTKTWFHNGAFLEEGTLEAYFQDPANQEYFTGDSQATFLPDPDLPGKLSVGETREAARARKGSILHQEIYADDGSARASLPFSVSESSYRQICLQPRGPNLYAVFFNHPYETIDYHYERNPADPRISHALTLAIDDFGNVLQSVAIGYARRTPAFDEQAQTLATLSENQYTAAVLDDDAYRAPLPAELKSYELTAPAIAGPVPLSFAAVGAIAAGATEISYEAQPDPLQPNKRLIGDVRTLYRTNDLAALSPLGQVESLALPGESYKLAFTPGLLAIFQTRASAADLMTILTGTDGGYRNLDGDGRLWIPSGRVFFSPNTSDSASVELAFAQSHFYLLHRVSDPFGNVATAAYDAEYTLALVSTRDAVGNQTTADPDFRVLQPAMVTDPNGNRTSLRFDALGMLAGTALLGKATGPAEGDTFDNFAVDLAPTEIAAFFATVDPTALAVTNLGTATTRIIYDLDQMPVCAASIARETHVSDLAAGQQTKVQFHFVYGDGFGREAQTRARVAPGPLDTSNPSSPVQNPRWVGTGAKIYNNKGKPVRQFEPFFSATPRFGIETWGVSSTLFYDPLERVVATLHPNNTFAKVVFDPWQQTSYDVNDTVTFDPTTDPDVGEFFSRLPGTDYLPTWYDQRISGALGPEEQAASQKTAPHANTPAIAHADSLGRAFLTIADNGQDSNGNVQQYPTRTDLDIEGNPLQVVDALGRVTMRYDHAPLGVVIHQSSIDAGERWSLNNVAAKPIYAWDSREHEFRTTYDALQRPSQTFLTTGTAPEVLIGRTVYGESLTNPEAQNQRGKVVQLYDQAGLVTTENYDFKGNLLSNQRQFAVEYKATIDWSSAGVPLNSEVFTTGTTFDALNRPTSVTTPDLSVYHPSYDESTLLQKVDVNLQGTAAATPFVANITYNAKRQRLLIAYGNNVQTAYTYDPLTFRLTSLSTTRGADQALLQDLGYTCDPIGNITEIRDGSQQTIYFNNQVVTPSNAYTYDAIYRLINATGREQIGQASAPQTTWNDAFRVGLPLPGDSQAMRGYVEEYQYDVVGNFLKLIHQAANGNWTRSYAYNDASLLEPAMMSNRLSSTTVGGTAPATDVYTYDAHGNTTAMPHLTLMQWDYRDELQGTARQVVNDGIAETTYYIYDATGQRVRKVTEGQTAKMIRQRIYLGGYEVYREYDGSGSTVTLERETLHVMDDRARVALVDTRTQGDDGTAQQLIRYQYSNHLESASLELDEVGQVISYEEYYSYGSTSYQAGRSAAEVSLKRYRYTSMERDDETGFTYHGARYYAAWLGRWTSSDPEGMQFPDWSAYAFVFDNPLKYVDSSGMAPNDPQEKSLRQQAKHAKSDSTNLSNELYSQQQELKELNQRVEKLRSQKVGEPEIAKRLDAEYNDLYTRNSISEAQARGQIKSNESLLKDVESLESKIGHKIPLDVELGGSIGDAVKEGTDVLRQRLLAQKDLVFKIPHPPPAPKTPKAKEPKPPEPKPPEKPAELPRAKVVERDAGIIETIKKFFGFGKESAAIGKTAKETTSLLKGGLELGGAAARAAGKTAFEAIPYIGAAICIEEGVRHLAEGRYVRAAVDFAEAIPIVGDAVLVIDLTYTYFGDVLMTSPGSMVPAGIATPFLIKPLHFSHCFAGAPCSYRSEQ
jgi:RHS repeat-associated protein